MKTVTIGISSRAEMTARAKAGFRGEKQGERISFPSFDLMHRTLTPNRLAALSMMMGAGPMAVRELARRLKRDIKSVHGDVQALLTAGVIDHTPDGQIIFPYDAAHIRYEITPAAA
jgi:predicted transcriptional regulator